MGTFGHNRHIGEHCELKVKIGEEVSSKTEDHRGQAMVAANTGSLERGREQISLTPFVQETSPVTHMISDFQPPQLYEEMIRLCGFQECDSLFWLPWERNSYGNPCISFLRN